MPTVTYKRPMKQHTTKLEYYGIIGLQLTLLKSYLETRRQRVTPKVTDPTKKRNNNRSLPKIDLGANTTSNLHI